MTSHISWHYGLDVVLSHNAQEYEVVIRTGEPSLLRDESIAAIPQEKKDNMAAIGFTQRMKVRLCP